MKVAQTIRKRLHDSGPDSLWSFDDFGSLPQVAVAKSLSRLAKEGRLRRIRKGLYYYPKATALGESRPSSAMLATKVARKSKSNPVYSGGTAAFQNLGITTQIPAHYTLLADMASRKITVGKMTIRIQRRSVAHLAGASQIDVWILEAIRNLKLVPDATPAEAIVKIMAGLKKSDRSVKKLLRLAKGEPPRVRAVLGAIAERIGYSGAETRALKKSLNPLTKFHLGVSSVLPNSAAWNIV